MKRNLRKVISTVLALSLSLSSFMALGTASSAATFTDVADTASYSEAVEALAAIGAISGYEDGTFLPNNNITRAEVTTMVVAALNMSEDAKNSGSTTKFADVNANAAWAAGYVNIGVAQGFISGMSADEFAPSDNVTYAQILTMLTRILGYGEFAESRGGYPNGYLSAASTAGILSGVSASANDAMTRAQVAQLIWNAVQAPVLDITTFSTSLTEQKMEKLDGNGNRDFRTLLSDKFNAYVLNVSITANSKGGNGTAGEVSMKLIGNNDYDPEVESIIKNIPGTATWNQTKTGVKVGKTAAEDYLFASAKAIVEYNDDEEWTILYFAPTSKVATKTVDGTLIAEMNASEPGISTRADGDLTLRINKSKTSTNGTNYVLTSDAHLYVNGVDNGLIKGNEAAVREIIANSTGDTTLVEKSNTSNKYDTVMVDYYATAKVGQVTSKNGKSKVTLSAFTNIVGTSGTSFDIDDDEIALGEKSISVTKAGAAAELTALAVDDIIAIKYDVTKANIKDSAFYEIIATNETVTGRYTGYDEEEETYSVGGETYEAVTSLRNTAPANSTPNGVVVGSTYTFRLDPFGKLYEYEEEATSKNYAIIESYVDISKPGVNSSSDTDYMRVVTLDGQVKTLYVYNSYQAAARAKIATNGKVGTSATNTEDDSIESRVISYTVRNSDGKVNSFDFETVVPFTTTEYKEASNRLGGALSSTAVVLDATNYEDKKAERSSSDFKASSLSALGNGVEYDGFLVYKTSKNDYAYVVITKAGSTFSGTSDVVVAAADASTNSQAQAENGDDVYTLSVIRHDSDGDIEKLNIDMSVKVMKGNATATLADVKRGSMFVYTTNSDGYVDEINILYQHTAADMATLLTQAKTSTTSANLFLPASANIKASDWAITLKDNAAGVFNNADEKVQVVFGVVLKGASNRVEVGNVEQDSDGYYVNVDATETFSVDSSSRIVSFALDGTKGTSAFDTGVFSANLSTSNYVDGKAYLANTANHYDFSDAVQVAVLVVVDGTVQTGIVIDD